MQLKRLTTVNDDMFEAAMRLYKLSFPYNEQREFKPQKAIMNHGEYHFNLIFGDGVWVGNIFTWETQDFVYVEHFCILPEKRNRRYGEKTLAVICSQNPKKKIILEIDPPADEISLRRKGFYERCGFVSNNFAHIQPTYHKGEKGLPLVVMSYPDRLTDTEYENFYAYMQNVVFAEDKKFQSQGL